MPQRADFNTLDNPFFWSADPETDGMVDGAAAGVHFVVFNPTSDDFRRTRLRDGRRAARQHPLPSRRATGARGSTRCCTTTHRQNFLVPPRRNRSFPLAELL